MSKKFKWFLCGIVLLFIIYCFIEVKLIDMAPLPFEGIEVKERIV